MKKTVLFILCITLFTQVFAQNSQPVIAFQDNAQTHNMGITSDGNYYFAVNGGTSSGLINQYDLSGNFIKSYSFPYDMRNIDFANGSFYVGCCNGNIYRIDDLNLGTSSLIFEQYYDECQISFSVANDGSSFFIHKGGTVTQYDINSGNVLNTLRNIKHGKDQERNTIACDKDGFYTFDVSEKKIYKYDYNGYLLREFRFTEGKYSFSLSEANGLIFISNDGNYSTGTWFGYDLNNSNTEATYYENQAQQQVEKKRNTRPQIHIHQPNLNNNYFDTYDQNVTIAGQANSQFGIFEVEVNGIDAQLQEGGFFNIAIPLGYGDNTVHIKATDTRMNVSETVVTVRRQ